MKRIPGTLRQDNKPETRHVDSPTAERAHIARPSFAEARFSGERTPCSPRAAVAFSALSARVWLREKLRSLARRISRSHTNSQAPGKTDPTIYIVKSVVHFCATLLLLSVSCAALHAQQAASAASANGVPRLVSFSGKLTDAQGKPSPDVAGITFAIYKDRDGGSPLWIETQTVKPDGAAHYTVQLGSTRAEGLPLDLFSTGEARWLGVQVSGQPEQPRVLLLSVPYALKAADAETIGGLPPSAFVLATPANGSPAPGVAMAASLAVQSSAAPAVTGSGTANYLPLWMDNSGTLGNSAIFQTGTSPGAKVGVNITPSLAILEVQGTEMVHGQFTLPSAGFATASGGKKSFPLDLRTSVFSSSTSTAVPQNFQWVAEPVDNNTTSATGSLNLLFGQGSAAPTETGLRIASNGQLTFALGQTFPGTGPGTITGVSAGSLLKGGGSGGHVTLSVDTAKVPQLAAANIFTGDQLVVGNLSSTGALSGNSLLLGGNVFDFGSFGTFSAFLGYAGSPSSTGQNNLGVGYWALRGNTSGSHNTAVGSFALSNNTIPSDNTAVGYAALNEATYANGNTAIGSQALELNLGGVNTAAGWQALASNTSGQFNVAIGGGSLYYNVDGNFNTAVGTSVGGSHNAHGSYNTFLGYGTAAGFDDITNSTAIGNSAEVYQSNTLTLGGIHESSVTVGIGTFAPYNDYALDVETPNSNGTINGGVVVNASGGNLYLGMTNTVHKFRVDTNGAVYSDGGFFSNGADFAESVAVHGLRSEYEPGDVLEIDQKANRRLGLSHRPYATLVAGIYSTKPGVLASPHPVDQAPGETAEVPLAVMGIVPCKVTTENGAIARGDLLVTSSRAGYAMKGTDRRRMLGAVVGKALEPLSKGSGTIEVLVTLQ
jgi:hypothetical protein